MKQTIGILCFLISACAIGQNQKLYVTTPTVAYSDASGTTEIGVYTRGAYLENIEKVNNVYKVTNEQLGTMYILDTDHLKEVMIADDTIEASPAPIIDFDDYYGSPHLFTVVGGLKVRTAPNHQSETIGVLYNGTAVGIDYYPYDKEAWTKIHFNEGQGYIPVKYLGKRPNLNSLITSYKKATEAKDQKRFIQRIIELGWNSNDDDNAKALLVFADYADKNNQADRADIARLQAEVLKAIPDDGIYEKTLALASKKLIGFTLNNVIEPKKGFSLATLEKSFGKIKDSYAHLDDCALENYESNIIFNTAECIGHDINKTYTLRIIEMGNGAGFKINNSILSENTTEKEFLKIGKGLINTILNTDKAYQIPVGDSAYRFTFKEGKLNKIELIYFC